MNILLFENKSSGQTVTYFARKHSSNATWRLNMSCFHVFSSRVHASMQATVLTLRIPHGVPSATGAARLNSTPPFMQYSEEQTP